jgi:hypothetical protein
MNARGTRAQWGIADAKGATTDDPAKEVGRADLTMGKPAALVETPKIALAHTDATSRQAGRHVGECDGIGAVHREVNWPGMTSDVRSPVPILPAENSTGFNLHLRTCGGANG